MAVQTNKLSIRNLSKFDWKSVNQLENIMHWKNNILTTSLSFVSFKEISTDCVRNLCKDWKKEPKIRFCKKTFLIKKNDFFILLLVMPKYEC